MKRLSLIASVLALTLCHAGTPWADTTITYQGRLDSGGQPHTGTVGMVFELYDQENGGTQQGPTLNRNVQVTDGLFQAEVRTRWTTSPGLCREKRRPIST